jgi:hypothetical protein
VDRRAEAAAVSAIANGSQHSAIKAISNQIARSLSVWVRSARRGSEWAGFHLDLPALSTIEVRRVLRAARVAAASFLSPANPARARCRASIADRAVSVRSLLAFSSIVYQMA